MLTSQATSLILLLLAGSSHAVQICCSSFAGNTCTKDQYERHRQNIILNQMINYRGENCQRKGAGPGAWTDKKNWSEYYECEVWNGFQHQIEAGDCTLFCTTTNGIDYKPCI
ncbi:hypothetical protein C8035_v010493 [Colletotrichum spinosum]|uniref:Secreted in xylem 11 n=1 Tax=Colletotrichum spinosum TaxID=1347390 RepID=A0A4R8PXG2_9PEZI|nr:hypothetical protein C8035_v010493 [Colletotrichum spinosum]